LTVQTKKLRTPKRMGYTSCNDDLMSYSLCILIFFAVLRIRIHRIHVFLGLQDPDPDPLVRVMDPDPAPDPDPSIIMQK
jgi:hypothetical protein